MKLELRQEAPREQEPVEAPDFARWRSADGEVTASFHRVPEGFLVRFGGRADFVVALGDNVVTCRPAPGMSGLAAQDLYLNQILPMVRGHYGEPVIHASAVAVGAHAVAFVGQTGRGKSTLAAAFARAGFPFLSDDGVVLTRMDGHYVAAPNRPSFRLYEDSVAAVVRGDALPADPNSEKSRVTAREAGLPFQDQPLPVAALYFLGERDVVQPEISPLRMRRTLAELMNHAFFLDAEDRGRMTRHLETLGSVAESVPGYALDYPREYDRLPCVIAAVSRHVQGIGGLE